MPASTYTSVSEDMGRNNLRHKTLPIELTQGLTDIAKVRLEHVVNKLSRGKAQDTAPEDALDDNVGLIFEPEKIDTPPINENKLILRLRELRKYTNGQFSYILGWTDRILKDSELFLDAQRQRQEYVSVYKFLCRLAKAYAAQEGEDQITPRFFELKKDPDKLLLEAHKIRAEQYKTKSYAGAGKP